MEPTWIGVSDSLPNEDNEDGVVIVDDFGRPVDNDS